jgi:hypothetical protein
MIAAAAAICVTFNPRVRTPSRSKAKVKEKKEWYINQKTTYLRGCWPDVLWCYFDIPPFTHLHNTATRRRRRRRRFTTQYKHDDFHFTDTHKEQNIITASITRPKSIGIRRERKSQWVKSLRETKKKCLLHGLDEK